MPTSRYNEANHRKDFKKLKGKKLYYLGRINKLDMRVGKSNLEASNLLINKQTQFRNVLNIKSEIFEIKKKDNQYDRLILKNKNNTSKIEELNKLKSDNEKTQNQKEIELSLIEQKIQEIEDNKNDKIKKINSDKIKISKYNEIITNINKHLEKFDDDGNRNISNINPMRRLTSSMSRLSGQRKFVYDSKSRSDSNNRSTNSTDIKRQQDIDLAADAAAEKALEKLIEDMDIEDIEISNKKGGNIKKIKKNKK